MLGPPIRDDEPDDDEIAAIRGGRTKYIVGALVLGVLVGAGAYFKATTGSFNPFAKAEVKPPEPTPPAPTPPTPPEVKPDDKTAAKPDDKTAAKPDDKAAAKPDDKTAAKPDDKAAAKPDDKTAAKPDDKTAAKPDDKTAAKPDDKTAAKPDDKTAAKPDDKTAAKPDDKTAAKPPETGVPSGKGYDFYIQSADRLRNRNQASLALQYYEKAIEEQPGTAEPIAGKAFCLVDLDRHDEAITLFRKALEIYPRYLPAIMGLAEAYKEKGDKKQALEYYTRYVDQAPDGPEAGIARAAIEKLNKE
jgi:tetratricopeptide (TPR) repeat protein